jgi:enoyl-CoA hydratase/carnithine racemase
MSTRIVISSVNDVALLSLETPDAFPQLTLDVLNNLAREIARVPSSVAGVVVTGNERAFAVGADIQQLSQLSPLEANEFSRDAQRALLSIARSPIPVIAAIRGYCLGGGLDLALACHARIATPDAIFAHPGGALGILTGWGGTQRLPRLIGRSRALSMLVTGYRLDAREALDCGLISAITSSGSLIQDAAVRARTLAASRVSAA